MEDTQENQPEQSHDNAIVSAITSMSELLATSLSSLKTTMTNSFTEIQSSLEQFAVTDVGDFLDIEALDHGESPRKRPRIATEELPQQSGATARDEPLMVVPQREIDKLISPPSLTGEFSHWRFKFSRHTSAIRHCE